MAAGFSVLDSLNRNSKAGVDESPKARFRTKDISVFKMYRNESNFYEINDIEELAAKILMTGLMENMAIVYDPSDKGEYRIISGERRWEGLKLLVSRGYTEFEIATCQIRTLVEKSEEEIEIIISNSQRVKSIQDMLEEEKRLKANLEHMKETGMTIKGYDLSKGRLRDIIADMLQISKTKVALIENINNNLIPEFKEELKADRLTFSAANEISGMTEEKQNEVYEKYRDTGSITLKEVKEIKQVEAEQQEEDEPEQEENQEEEQVESHIEDQEVQKVFNPTPEVITSKCYSCENWDICSEKGPTVTYCKDLVLRISNTISDRAAEDEANAIEKTSQSQPIKEEIKETITEEKSHSDTKVHNIKIASMYFEEVLSGIKPFELRKNDSDYKIGDRLNMAEYAEGTQTGRFVKAVITCMLQDYTGITDGYCILGIEVIK